MDLKRYIAERSGQVEAAMLQSIGDPSIPRTLRDAMAYSLNAGGKRLRPVLCIAGAEAVGGGADRVMHAAVALEMIHTFSLIHDDLPAMDDDSLRRGKPTNHKVYGEAVAILAGDGLLAEAFYVLAGSAAEPRLLIETIRDIASATGGRGMTGGQVYDMESTGKRVSVAQLEALHRFKTGALIRVAVTSGARLCGATAAQLEALANYGEAIGLAFQIADDLLDIEGDQALLGKDVGSDQENGKSTYPALLGLEESRTLASGLVESALAKLSPFGEAAEPLRQIARYTIERNQ